MARKSPKKASKAANASPAAPAAGAKGPVSLSDLRRVPAFSGMDDGDACTFLELMTERHAAAGEPIFAEGDPGEGLYVILEGSVGITRRNAKGGEREVAILEKGEVFGEMDLISDRPHTSGAKGREECRMLYLPKAAFQDLLRRGNKGAASMVSYFARMLAGRLDAMNRRMLDLLDGGRPAQAGSEFAEFKRRLLKEWSF